MGGSGLFGATSTSTTGASHGANTGLPVVVEGRLGVKSLGTPVGEEVDAGERDELVHSLSGVHFLQPGPLPYHGDHAIPGELGPQHLVVSLRVNSVFVGPDGPAQCMDVVHLDCRRILSEEGDTQGSISVEATLKCWCKN